MRLQATKYSIKGVLRRIPLGVHDWKQNRQCVGIDRRFLVVRHAGKNPYFYDVILHWLAQHLPEIRSRFELRLLPCRISTWSEYALHIPWLQDPVQAWSRRAFVQARRLAEECDRHQIPVVNRVETLANAAKSEAAQRIARLGIRTPRICRIDDYECFRETRYGCALPLLVRDDFGHGGSMLRADTDAELKQMPLERLRRPIAVEIIDVRSPEDGLYRKYRYVAAGNLGVPHHLQFTREWITRGTIRVHTSSTRAEELAYVHQPDPNHELFERARRALELNVVAFDYGYTPQGELVIWEANPYPHIHLPHGRLSYLRPAVHRTLVALVHLYLQRAGMPIPDKLQEELFQSIAISQSDAATKM